MERKMAYPVLPEHIQLCVRHDNAVEQAEYDQEAWQDVADDGEARSPSADPLAPA